MVGCFGFFNPETFCHIKGIFKLKDIIYVSIFSVFFLHLLVKPSRKIIKTPFNIVILAIVFLTIFEILYTLCLYPVSLVSAIQTGRDYFAFLLFFPALYFWNKDKKLFFSLKIFLVISVAGALLIIGATVFGQDFLLPSYLKSKLKIQSLGGFDVNRLYIPGNHLIAISYSMLFWLIAMNRKLPYRRLLVALTLLLGMAWFFSFSRANWIFMCVTMISPILFSKKAREIRLKIICLFLSLFLLLMMGSFIITETRSSSSWRFLFNQIGTIPSDIIKHESTFGYRMKESQYRFAVLKDHFWLGSGFLHPKYVPQFYEVPEMIADKPERWGLTSVDWGLLNLLINFGMLGVAWFVSLVVVVHRRMKKIIHALKPIVEKSLVIGALAWFWGAVISFVTLPNFTYFPSIILFATLLAAVESVYATRQIQQNI
ncbi:MAG: O-antigen ligase family protein [Candidatus Atribacteria bacterium]|nr:O-antigen ligase family protein [Candidatus Atribacteria bacterium]